MPTDRRYYDDATTTAFTSRVRAHGAWQGRAAVELEASWFYPESGGQLADRGTLGDARVLDVQVDEAGAVWHVVEGPLPPLGAEVAGTIDGARRFDHMQQHTGQHVLSATFERLAGVATLSSTLGEERCVIELGLPSIGWEMVARIEEAANRVVWENRELRFHWTDGEGIARFPLRKPPRVSGPIRVVEIPDWDFSACGGTHVARTGGIGTIKVVGWEKVRGNVRLVFHSGERAWRDHAWRTEALVEAAKRRTLKDRDLLAHLERALDERDAFAKQLREQAARRLAEHAHARVGTPASGVAEFASARSRADVRAFAVACLEAGAPWVVSASGGSEPALVVARARGAGADADTDLRGLLPDLLAASRGKGGGSPEMLQIAPLDEAGARAAFERARSALAGGGAPR